MIVTRFRWWHIPDVVTIEADLFGVEQWSPAMFWNELASGHHYLVALDEAGTLVGYAGLALAPPDEAWVQNIAVRRDARLGEAILVGASLGERPWIGGTDRGERLCEHGEPPWGDQAGWSASS